MANDRTTLSAHRAARRSARASASAQRTARQHARAAPPAGARACRCGFVFFACGLLSAALLAGCGGEDDSQWKHPSWGTVPLDTTGPNGAPPPVQTQPYSYQETPATSGNSSTPAETAETAVETPAGGMVLRLDNVEVTTTGWAACQFYDWRMVGMLPWFGISKLSSIPLFGQTVYQSVKWGKRFFAFSDIKCDIRAKVTLGGDLADREFEGSPVMLFDGLNRAELSGRTVDVTLLDCEYCEGDDFEWTTKIGICSKAITGTELDTNQMQMECIFEPMQWLERQADSWVELPPEEERAFPTVSARLTFSFQN
jgi:hypothetical protein